MKKEIDDMDDEFYNGDLEEESEKINPLMAAGVFLGLIIVAAVICVVLWSVTHKDSGESVNAPETVQEESGENDNADLAELETEAADSEIVEDESPETEVIESMADEMTEVFPNNEFSDVDVENSPVAGSQAMAFAEVDETVTSKDVTNLRSLPNTTDAENVVGQLLNGETLSRTGINEDTGWSRLDYNGQTVYAVSGYLTTDFAYKPPVVESDPNRITTQDGRIIIFTDCDDHVTPKEYVNLRIEPSTSQGEATVKCQIHHGDVVHRTGYSPDSGWSRVEYNGEILYVVSSYVYNQAATE